MNPSTSLSPSTNLHYSCLWDNLKIVADQAEYAKKQLNALVKTKPKHKKQKNKYMLINFELFSKI